MNSLTMNIAMFVNFRNNALPLLLGVLFPCIVQASIVTTDTEFNDSDWTSVHLTRGIGAASGTQSGAMKVDVGGNPDAYRRSSHIHGGSQNGNMWSWFFNFDNSFVFDPSLGPLTDLSIAFDGIIFSSLNGHAQFGPSVRQDGRIFHFDPMASGQGTFDWERYEFNLLSESSFAPSEEAFPSASVDFSSSGSLIEFGYWSLTVRNFTASAITGADNWRLEVNSQPGMGAAVVPEPGALAIWSFLFGIGFIAHCRNRKRV